jgi:hypothetical protein
VVCDQHSDAALCLDHCFVLRRLLRAEHGGDRPARGRARALRRLRTRSVVAFSCKNRGICTSCSARRMYDTAIHLSPSGCSRTCRSGSWVLSLPRWAHCGEEDPGTPDVSLPATGPPKARRAALLELDERPADELRDELPH